MVSERVTQLTADSNDGNDVYDVLIQWAVSCWTEIILFRTGKKEEYLWYVRVLMCAQKRRLPSAILENRKKKSNRNIRVQN